MDYSTEPKEIFFPLSAERYSEFYDFEMSDFAGDLPFYLHGLGSGKDILELGCGSGRLSRLLAAHGHTVIGIDISWPMLARANEKATRNVFYICMDMTRIGINKHFDAVIVPYNTFNLLPELNAIRSCLKSIRGHLHKGGILLLQVFVADRIKNAEQNDGIFQFQIFNRPEGGKIIKEIIKKRHPGSERIIFHERYRVRPVNGPKEDLIHTRYIPILSCDDWVHLLHETGFAVTSQFGGYDLSPFAAEKTSMLLLSATPKNC